MSFALAYAGDAEYVRVPDNRKALGGLVGGLSIIMLLAAFSRHVMQRAKPEASPDQPTLRVVRFFACAPLRLRMTFLHRRKALGGLVGVCGFWILIGRWDELVEIRG